MDAPRTVTDQSETIELPSSHWFRRLFVAVVVSGLAWRAVRYLAGFPIWGDEATLLLNIEDRDFTGLTQPLLYYQVAPLFFLWLQRAALLLFGGSELSVHLFPTLAGVAAFAVFWRLSRSFFPPVVASFAIALLAVSYYPVRHASEVKPYAFDLLCASLFAWLTLLQLRDRSSNRWLLALIAMTPLAIFSSYPSVFVGGAVSLVLLPRMRAATWRQRFLYGSFNLVLVSAFVSNFEIMGLGRTDSPEVAEARETLHNYWRDSFPPAEAWKAPWWLLKNLAGNMLAYPIGAARGGSSITLLFVLIGSVALWRSRQRSLLALCWLPFALNLFASAVGKYPFGGSARICQHLAPFIVILMAHGIGDMLARTATPIARTRFQLSGCCLLLMLGIFGIGRDLMQPYKTDHDRDVRLLVRDMARKASNGEPVRMCNHFKISRELLPEFVWYLRRELPGLRWAPDTPFRGEAEQSCWLIMSGEHELSVRDLMRTVGDDRKKLRVTDSEATVIVPEHRSLSRFHCRTVHAVRR